MEFKTWKTIKLGTGIKDAEGFRKELQIVGIRMADWAYEIIEQPAFTVSLEEVELVNVSVAELGFTNSVHFNDICHRALELGLELCPAEVGPQLRLQYRDQPEMERLRIAMEPIADFGGHLCVFEVENYLFDSLWLFAKDCNPDCLWDINCRFVFQRRK